MFLEFFPSIKLLWAVFIFWSPSFSSIFFFVARGFCVLLKRGYPHFKTTNRFIGSAFSNKIQESKHNDLATQASSNRNSSQNVFKLCFRQHVTSYSISTAIIPMAGRRKHCLGAQSETPQTLSCSNTHTHLHTFPGHVPGYIFMILGRWIKTRHLKVRRV